ncbi:MAG: TlpA disulfide reductase family protein [Candidatus Riflebacteria bacterium]
MNRNHAILLFIAILTFPLISLFIPDSEPGTVSSLDGVELSNVTGQKFKFSGIFTDKPTMLVFWSITCGTCIEEIPFVSRLHETYKDRVTIIGIHPPGRPLKKIQGFLRKRKEPIPYMLAIDENGELLKNYEVTVLPRTILINRQGQVLYDHLGYDPSQEKEIEDAIVAKL